MMRKVVYKSTDGKDFETISECREYERAASSRRLVGLKLPAIEAAIAGHNHELAIAIKKVANMISIQLRTPPVQIAGNAAYSPGTTHDPATGEALADPTGRKAGMELAMQLDERRQSLGEG